jgi:hypothetical protein
MSADDKTPADQLMAYVEADVSHLADPLVFAAECAKRVVDGSDVRSPKDLAVAMNGLVPTSATVFERGMALGMMVALRSAENSRG